VRDKPGLEGSFKVEITERKYPINSTGKIIKDKIIYICSPGEKEDDILLL